MIEENDIFGIAVKRHQFTPENIESLLCDEFFVFGSNLA